MAYATGGYSGARNGWTALRARRLNVDVLMLVAAAGAAALGEYLDGGVLLFLFSLSETLQIFALGRTERALKALMNLRPDVANLLGPEGETTRVRVEDLRVGQRVIVRPGERLPVDGVVRTGASDVDQSPITGESLPVPKEPGDEVFAATINASGVLEVEVRRMAGESTLARIIALVAEAQATRAPTQRFIDRFGDRYAWGVIAGSLAMMVLPPALLGWTWFDSFYRAMTLLVVASPCALVISTPASYLSAIANAARHGVLLKGGAYLEVAALVDTIALDKTGTLTTGRPTVTDVVALDGLSGDDLLASAAAVERHSEHLLARAVTDEAARRGLAVGAATAIRSLPGLGIRARVDGATLTVSSPRLSRSNGGLSGPAEGAVDRLESEGKTTMVVTRDGGHPLGVIAVADAVRPEAAPALAALRRLGIKRLVMVTGDNRRVALGVAREVGIAEEDVRADLMPADKVSVVEEHIHTGIVAFVGDGVNDAPAIATAHLGIAMGGRGTDAALDSADVVLMADRLDRLAHVFGLGRAARRVVKQNVAFSLAVIVVLVIATVWRGIPLPIGVLAHEGSTVLVVLNGLRLLRYQTDLGDGMP